MESNKYDISLIRKYLNGELDARAMYQLERQAHEDPMLMDLIMGMELGDQQEHDKTLLEIDELIDQRVKPEKSRIVPLFRWSIAASVIIISGIAALFILRKDTPERISITDLKKPVIVVDSLPKQVLKDAPDIHQDQTKVAEAKPKPKTFKSSKKDNYIEVSKGKQQIAMLEPPGERGSGVLNEVVITGYPTQKRKELTGSVATVKAEELNPQIALQGRVAGVEVENAESKTIRIRGLSSKVAKDRTAALAQITGTVTDKSTRQALPGVFVKIKGTDIATVTDINGRFKLAVPDAKQVLELAFVGFDRTSVKVNSNDSVVIAMNPSSSALNEVVVVGYGSKKDTDDTTENENNDVSPTGGWEEYNKYIKGKAIVSKGQRGTVVLTFSVSSNGSLSDFKIIKTDQPSLNVQAIKLVLDGPQWHGPKVGTQKVRLRIKFKETED